MRLKTFSLAALFLAVWAGRIHSLHPAFHPDDSPETATAGYLPGIQHPPGYPLPTLLGRLACVAMPGSPALAQNLASSFFACLLIAAFALALSLLTGSLWLGLAFGLGLAGMPQLAFQAASAKGGIYTLNALLTLGCLWAFHAGGKKGLALGFLFLGLGLAGHYMSIVLFAPAMALWLRPQRRRLAQPALWVLPGLSLYLYLPLRAALRPELNWSDPSSLERFWYTLTRAQYSGIESARSLEKTSILVRHFFSLLPEQLPWLLLPLAAWGTWLAWSRASWRLRPLVYALAAHGLAVVLYNNPPSHAAWVINAFFLPDFITLWFLAALGASALLPKFGRELAAVLVLLLAWKAPSNYRGSDFSQDYLFYDYSRDLLETLPKDAVLLGAGGADAFGVWYLQSVEKRRRDVVLVDVPLLSDWYLEQLRQRLPELKPQWNSRDEVVGGLLGAQLKRPLYYSTHNPGDRGIPLALVSYAPAPGQNVPLSPHILARPWLCLRTRFLQDARTPMDGNRAELMEYYPASARALARFAARQGLPQLRDFAHQLERSFHPGR